MRKRHNKSGQKNSAVANPRGSAGSNLDSTDGQVVTFNSTENSPTTRLRRLLPSAWAMIRPYWSSEDRWAAWGLLLIVIALSLGMVHISVLFNQWNNAFYTALQEKNNTVFLHQLLRLS